MATCFTERVQNASSLVVAVTTDGELCTRETQPELTSSRTPIFSLEMANSTLGRDITARSPLRHSSVTCGNRSVRSSHVVGSQPLVPSLLGRSLDTILVSVVKKGSSFIIFEPSTGSSLARPRISTAVSSAS